MQGSCSIRGKRKGRTSMSENAKTYGSTNPNVSMVKHNAYLLSRLGAAFACYLVLLAVCFVFDPNENDYLSVAACFAITLASTTGFCVACFATFAKAGNKFFGASSNKADSTDNVASSDKPEKERAEKAHANAVQKEQCVAIGKQCGLTKREMEVFELLLEGKNARDIETSLCISRYTAKTHIGSVYRKTNVHSQQALIGLLGQESDHGE